MANSDYSYNDVLSGTGYYRYESPIVFSSGVLLMQQRLNNIGYGLDPDGKYGLNTQRAVSAFQTECALTKDGCAGKGTLSQLNKVYASPYFTTYGKPLNTWGYDYILNTKRNDIDLLARIIWVEERGIMDAQNAVAKVIKTRSTLSAFQEKSSSYPNASKWARVIGCHTPSAQYASATSASAKNPIRGNASLSSGLDSYWRNAVDLATLLVNENAIATKNGYTVSSSGVISSSKTTSVTSEVYQTGRSLFLNAKKNGITYNASGTGNYFY